MTKKENARFVVGTRKTVSEGLCLSSSTPIEGGRRVSVSGGNAAAGVIPSVSIVTASYNNDDRLQRCLDSVLMQTYRSFEHIVIDGASTDGTVERLDAMGDALEYFVSEPDSGIYDALNKGLAVSRGVFILVLHADDFLQVDALERAMQCAGIGECDVILGDSHYIDGHGWPVAYKPARCYGKETITRGIVGPHEAALISAEMYERVGCYDVRYGVVADYKLLRNCVLKGARIRRIQGAINYKEIGGASFDKVQEKKENADLLRELFPALSDSQVNQLYKLKNYNKSDSSEWAQFYEWLRTDADIPSELLRIIGLSLLQREAGDGPEQPYTGYLEDVALSACSPNGNGPVVLAIGKIKGVSAGAERVLIEQANALADRGYAVVIAAHDGKAGFPFYRLREGVRFVDIAEVPIAGYLDRGKKEELKGITEYVRSIIDDLPDEFIEIASAPKSIRRMATCANDLLASVRNSAETSVSVRRADVKAEVEEWVKTYGGRIVRWRRFVELAQPRVVVPFMISLIPQMQVAIKKNKTPMIASNHNNPCRDYYNQDEWDSRAVDRAMRLWSVDVATKSHWLFEEFVTALPERLQSNAWVIPNPARPARYRPPENEREKLVLGVGRLTDVKCFGVLIEAFVVASRGVPGWRLSIVGDGPEKNELVKKIEEHGVASVISILPPTRDIESFYKRASIYATTSSVEGFGLTVCEALGYGVPVVARKDCSGVNQIVNDGYNGYLVEAREESLVLEVSRALQRLMIHEEARVGMGQRGPSSLGRFKPDAVYSEWERLIESVTRGVEG